MPTESSTSSSPDLCPIVPETASGGTRGRYRARWLLNPGFPPIENAAVVVRGARILFAGRYQDAPGGGFVDLGDAAILPGFVNAHVHLDIEPLSAPNESAGMPSSFVAWLDQMIRQRRANGSERIASIVETNVQEIVRSGTTMAADIATTDHSEAALRRFGLKGWVFREIVGRRRERFEPLLRSALRRRPHRAFPRTGRIARGLSPHAPFSTAPAAFAAAGDHGVLHATHWRESFEEIEFLRNRRGPMLDWLRSNNALESDWENASIDVELLEKRLLGSARRWLLIHANYFSADDFARLANAKLWDRVAAVVYCPRTHHAFGHPRHPCLNGEFPVPWLLGTDSLATNPDLSILNEAAWLWRHSPGICPAELLERITRTAANALGFRHAGLVVDGFNADLAVVSGDFVGSADPLPRLFEGRLEVLGTMGHGRWLLGPLSR